jgi:hypothetical protein
MKYNDLLNKHLNLAAQKTVDSRPKQVMAGPQKHMNSSSFHAQDSSQEDRMSYQLPVNE